MSNAAPRGLGRGLGQLIQRSEPRGSEEPQHASTPPIDAPTNGVTAPVSESAVDEHPVPEGSYFAELPIGSIRPNPRQPRTVFDEDELNELVESITEVGLLQPIVVRPLGATGDTDNPQYELVMGERRWRACQAAELPAIPAIVRKTEEADLLRDALLENLHRSQLNPLEEAAAYQQMLEDFGCSQEELAQRIKRSRPQISNTIRLLRLPPTVQRRVAAGVLSAGHARALLMVEEPTGQERLAQRVVAEGLSVRATEELVTLGDGTEETKRNTPRRRAVPGPVAVEAADRLSDRLETRVRVTLGKTKGKITIDFASAEDMQRIVALIEGR